MTTPRNLSFLAEGVSSTGVLGATYGGTGQSSITTGDLLYGSASNTISKLAIGSTGTVLRVVAGVPSWGTDYTGTVTSVAATVPSFLSISGSPITTSGTLAITLSGTALPTTSGGTGLTSLTANYIPYGNGTGAFNSSANLAYDGTKVTIANSAGGATVEVLRLSNSGGGANTQAQASFYAAGTFYGSITAGYGASAPQMTFNLPSASLGNYVWQNNSVESMRLDSSNNLSVTGQLFVGATSTVASSYAGVKFNGAAYNGFGLNDSAAASGTGYIYFQSNGTTIGSIARVAATSAVVYNTTSDERLKTNIADASPVLDKLMDVKVRQYDWIDGDLHQDAGFIAQELEPILSGIVTKGKTEEDMWQLDYSRLTPYLVKAMQEQQTLIESLTQRIAILEAK